MIAYHGANQIFSNFNSDAFGSNTGIEQLGSGFYFTSSEMFARNYGSVIYKVDLNINNPYVIGANQGLYDIRLTRDEIKGVIKSHPNIYVPAGESIMNPLGDYSDSFWENCYPGSPHYEKNIEKSIDEVVEMIMESPTLMNADDFYVKSGVPSKVFLDAVKQVTGHDGIVMKTGKEDMYVAWDSNQINILEIKGYEKNNSVEEKQLIYEIRRYETQIPYKERKAIYKGLAAESIDNEGAVIERYAEIKDAYEALAKYQSCLTLTSSFTGYFYEMSETVMESSYFNENDEFIESYAIEEIAPYVLNEEYKELLLPAGNVVLDDLNIEVPIKKELSVKYNNRTYIKAAITVDNRLIAYDQQTCGGWIQLQEDYRKADYKELNVKGLGIENIKSEPERSSI